jgi:TolA-binding protein
MNSNRLHRIFDAKRRLSRDDIAEYGRSNDPGLKNDIEQKSMSHGFDADALEGWGDMAYDTSSLNRMDKKFSGSSNATLYWVVSIAIVSTVAIIGFYNYSPPPENSEIAMTDIQNDTITQLSEDQQITIEESDIVIPEAIDIMKAVPIKDRIQPKKIQKDFADMNLIKDEKKEVTTLPIKNDENVVIPEFISKRKTAKEIYKSNLKLVDYSVYRSTPSVNIKTIILTGTPADKEGKNSEGVETEYKTVAIPYMDYIAKSVRIFSRGNYKKALSRFEIIITTYPDDVNANFYAGLCLFNFGEYESAISAFNKCLDGPYSNFDEESVWMNALSYEHLGKKGEAKRLFKEILKSGGFYAKQAKVKLGQ